MNYSFLRQLTNPMEEASCQQVMACLVPLGLELYVQAENEQFRLVQGYEDVLDASGVIYVTAADRKKAVELLDEANLGTLVSEEIQPKSVETELERAKRLYYRKRKNGLIAWCVVIVLAFCYYLLKALHMM